MAIIDQVHLPRSEVNLGAVSSQDQFTGRVLVVDDEPVACKLLSVILGPPAFHCTTASSGEEALVALQRGQFDAVISDLHMPGVSGMGLLAEVRRCYPHLAFLVTTGVDDVDVGVKNLSISHHDLALSDQEVGGLAGCE